MIFSVSAEERENTLNYCPHIVSQHTLLKSFVAGEEREKIFCGDKSSGGSCCCFSKESQPDHKMKYNFDFDKEAQPVHKLRYNLNSDKDSQPVHKLK